MISIPETRIERVLWSNLKHFRAKALRILKMSRKQYDYVIVMPSKSLLEKVARLVEEKKVRAVVDRIYPIAEIALAHRYVEDGHASGKVVIMIT